jgi:hypothetical protein
VSRSRNRDARGVGGQSRAARTEGLLIASIGAGLGVVLSLVLALTFVSMAADFLPRADEIAVDWAVLLFAVLSAVVATLLSGLERRTV